MTTEQRLAICKNVLRRIVDINPACEECYWMCRDALEKVDAKKDSPSWRPAYSHKQKRKI